MSVHQSEIYHFSGYRLDLVRRQLLAPNRTPVALMPKAFDTLAHLVTHAGETVGKDDLLRAVWPNTVVEENNLTQNISALRKVFADKRGDPRFIVTIPGQGYRFIAPIEDPARSSSLPDGADAPRRRVPRWRFAVAAAITVAALGVGAWRALPIRSAAVERTLTIAVLPFKPVLPDQRNEAIELGMADSLIMELSRSEHLVVRPLSSTRGFTSLDQDPIAAGRELQVDAVVDGSIQIDGERLRASARLLGTEDGRNLWAGSFDEKFSSLFHVQDAIAQRLAQALEIRLSPRPPHQTENVRAYELYMRGRLHALRLVKPEAQRGIEYFEQAIVADPSYALPHAGIADALRAMVLSNDVPPTQVAGRARVAAQRAIELAPQLPEVNTACGLLALFFDWDWRSAKDYLERAVELAPNSGEAHIYLAHWYSNQGQKDEALAHARRATELNPITPMIVALEGQFLGYQGESDAAIRRLKDAISMEPNFWLAHHLLADALIDAGQYEASLLASAEAKRLSPVQTYSDALMGVALGRLGRYDEAEAILTSMAVASRETYVPPTHFALVEAARGNHDRAVEQLEAAFTARDARLAFLKVDRKWDGLRSHPGFQAIMKQMNF